MQTNKRQVKLNFKGKSLFFEAPERCLEVQEPQHSTRCAICPTLY